MEESEPLRQLDSGHDEETGVQLERKVSLFHKLKTWLNGSGKPRIYRIRPLLPSFEIFLEESKFLLPVLCVLSIITMICLVVLSSGQCSIGDHSSPVRMTCTSTLWPDASTCGLDGSACRPFHDTNYSFYCPAHCQDVIVIDPYQIGDSEINYQVRVFGGLKQSGNSSMYLYRSDSFVCGSAMHAGIVSETAGGAGVIRLLGEQRGFPGTKSNGIESASFAPSFPSSFTFDTDDSVLKNASGVWCKDNRWVVFAISFVYTLAFSLIVGSSAYVYALTFTVAFFVTALKMDPPEEIDFISVVSTGAGRYLPSAFAGAVIYIYCTKYALRDLESRLDRTILWVGGIWLGAMTNYTLDKLPIQRLTPHDLRTQAGAIPALIIILVLLAILVIGQVWVFRVEKRLTTLLKLYGFMAIGLLLLSFIPNLNLRVHHYMMGLLFLPGTTIQTRPSLLYQGFLIGLFINGVARWGFASILETDKMLGGPSGSLQPLMAPPSINGDTLSFLWNNTVKGFDSISIVINDVERFRGYEDHNPSNFTWKRHKSDEIEFFRFAYVTFQRLTGDTVWDYSKSSTWFPNGTWANP